MCIPSGTRHASTHTVQVPFLRVFAAMGVGSCSVVLIVAQSIPRDPMMCVPSVTVPERTAVPPELWKARVTSSHQRLSVALRVGAAQVRAAGVGGAGVRGAVVGAGVGAEEREVALLPPDLAAGADEDPGGDVGPGVDVGAGVVPGRPEVPLPVGDFGVPSPSSGTRVTLPVGRPAVADGRGGPTAT